MKVKYLTWSILCTLIIAVIVALCTYPNLVFGRKNHSIGGYSRSIEQSMRYRAFLFEYEVPSVIVYDSIQIPFKTAFAERNYKWKDLNTDSVWYVGNYNIVVLLNGKDIELPGYREHWVLDGYFNMDWSTSYAYRIEDFPPDTFVCHIEEHKHYIDSLGNIHYLDTDSLGRRWPCDTIQTFQLIRKNQ